jgi:hypothetical protein
MLQVGAKGIEEEEEKYTYIHVIVFWDVTT